MVDWHTALGQLNKETKCEYSLSGDSLGDLNWISTDIPKPTEEELIAAYNRYLNDYVRLRKLEYPPVEEQLDMLHKDMRDGTQKWVQLITSIKTRHPKGGG